MDKTCKRNVSNKIVQNLPAVICKMNQRQSILFSGFYDQSMSRCKFDAISVNLLIAVPCHKFRIIIPLKYFIMDTCPQSTLFSICSSANTYFVVAF